MENRLWNNTHPKEVNTTKTSYHTNSLTTPPTNNASTTTS
jgi:hypothetical protein